MRELYRLMSPLANGGVRALLRTHRNLPPLHPGCRVGPID
jgi:hypothetical protein